MQEQCIDRGTVEEFNVIIEISAFSNPIKYEIDKSSGALFVDRFIASQLQYPANYGYIPKSLCDDGDPIDVLVITPFPLISLSVIKCRALGMLQMEDESGIDNKIIALPIHKICQTYENVETVDDLPPLQLHQIEYFFKNYKNLDKGKWGETRGIGGKVAAMEEIGNSFKLYDDQSK